MTILQWTIAYRLSETHTYKGKVIPLQARFGPEGG